MSQDRNLDADANSGSERPDVERLLQNCLPEALAVDREQLFFQAGIAAGSAKHSMRLFWPSAAATMLIVSIGLGVTLYRQVGVMNDLRILLASAKSSPGQSVGPIQNVVNAANDSHTKPPLGRELGAERQAKDGPVIDFKDRSPLDERSRSMQRLASFAPLPPGRLTALGWEQLPAEMGVAMGNGEWGMGNRKAAGTASSTELEDERDSRLPHRPATYLELLRLYQEG